MYAFAEICAVHDDVFQKLRARPVMSGVVEARELQLRSLLRLES
jgi:hypothetical protein